MANIKRYLDKIRTAIYGKEVRGSLADGLEAINNETEDATEVAVNVEQRQDAVEQQFDDVLNEWTDDKPISNEETIAARTNRETGENHKTLGQRLDAENKKVTEQLAETEQKIREEADKKASKIELKNEIDIINLSKVDEIKLSDNILTSYASGVVVSQIELEQADEGIIQSYIDSLVNKGEIASTSIADDSITYNKLNHSLKNTFKKRGISYKVGSIGINEGNLTSSTNRLRSEEIFVEYGDVISIDKKYTNFNFNVFYFDENDVYLGYGVYGKKSVEIDSANIENVINDGKIEYVILTVGVGGVDDMTPYLGIVNEVVDVYSTNNIHDLVEKQMKSAEIIQKASTRMPDVSTEINTLVIYRNTEIKFGSKSYTTKDDTIINLDDYFTSHDIINTVNIVFDEKSKTIVPILNIDMPDLFTSNKYWLGYFSPVSVSGDKINSFKINTDFYAINGKPVSNYHLNQRVSSLEKKDGPDLKKNHAYNFYAPLNNLYIMNDITDYISNPNEITSHEYHTMFNDLILSYTDIATSELLGNVTDGHPLYKYELIPPSYKINANETGKSGGEPMQVPKVMITGNIHGNERGPTLSIYYFVKELLENPADNELLEFLKMNVHFIFIPLCNPSGWELGTYHNANDVNLNRDFPPYGSVTQPESQLIKSVIDSNKDMDFFIDFHNMAFRDGYIGYTLTNSDLFKNTLNILYRNLGREWQKKYNTGSAMPQNLDWVWGYNAPPNQGTVGVYTESLGIDSTLMEVINRNAWVYNEMFSEFVVRMGVEFLVNAVTGALRCKY